MSRFNFDQLLDMDAKTIVANAHHNIDRNGVHQFGIPVPIGTLINTRFEWQSTGVKTRPAARNRQHLCVSALLNQAAATLEAEAIMLKAKAEKLRQLALQANG